ncbi:MAG: hypothetical protein HC846_00225 [Blastocatellia bacterium]|nr:hypothetical protein [Blastocatellia bacterium]
MPTIIRAEYLSYYNRLRNSDKLFNIFLIQEDDGTFSCLTENGRRASNLVRRTVCENVRRERAESKFWEKIREKRNHRETPYRDESSGESYSQIASLYNSGTNTRIVEITNPTKSVEPKANIIVFPSGKK